MISKSYLNFHTFTDLLFFTFDELRFVVVCTFSTSCPVPVLQSSGTVTLDKFITIGLNPDFLISEKLGFPVPTLV